MSSCCLVNRLQAHLADSRIDSIDEINDDQKFINILDFLLGDGCGYESETVLKLEPVFSCKQIGTHDCK